MDVHLHAATRAALASPAAAVQAVADAAIQAHTGASSRFAVDPRTPAVTDASEFFRVKGVNADSGERGPGAAADDFPFLEVVFPVGLVVIYLFATPILGFIFRKLGFNGRSAFFWYVQVLHNFLLVLYSAWAASQSLPYVFQQHFSHGFFPVYCDTSLAIRTSSMMAHIWLNYLSKFWEFFDTVVLLVKGKRVSHLQSYHHAGIVMVMWLLSAARSQHGSYMVCFNATVHTIMYTYFLATSFGFSRQLAFLRPMITSIQILQFFIGVGLAIPAVIGELGLWGKVFPNAPGFRNCLTGAQSASTIFTCVYLVPLIVLFANFFIKQYLSKPAAKKKAE